jgi:glutamate/tyrosine decarboxylase-like PLP-dependent enzyme
MHLRAAPDFELFEPQGLSIVCFRYRAGGDGDAANKALLEHIQLGGELFVSSTVIDDRFWLRACFVNPRATDADVGAIPVIVRAAAHRLGIA